MVRVLLFTSSLYTNHQGTPLALSPSAVINHCQDLITDHGSQDPITNNHDQARGELSPFHILSSRRQCIKTRSHMLA